MTSISPNYGATPVRRWRNDSPTYAKQRLFNLRSSDVFYRNAVDRWGQAVVAVCVSGKAFKNDSFIINDD